MKKITKEMIRKAIKHPTFAGLLEKFIAEREALMLLNLMVDAERFTRKEKPYANSNKSATRPLTKQVNR